MVVILNLKAITFLLLIFTITTCSGISVFMLVGGTGSLAGKYLWDAVFREIYMKHNGEVSILTSGRTDVVRGEERLRTILNGLKCSDDDDADCDANLRTFVSQIKYIQLENDIQFAKFCKDAFAETLNITEVMWYLATPPNFYPMVLMSVHSRCRYNNVPVKAALEKPFWKDASEHTILSRIIQGKFTDNELYFVDHYLLKSTALVVNEFKKLNSKWYKIKNLERVELVLLEREQIKDTRLSYYDRYGVVRDVMQSHLNEIMLLVLSEKDDDEDADDDDVDYEILSKVNVIQRLRPFSRSSWIVGQHSNYKMLTKSKSKTPTFASLHMKFDVSPESGDTREKPVVLVAGKYMDGKRSYARMIFKSSSANGTLKEVIFLLSAPVIFVSVDEVFKINVPDTWTISDSNEICSKWLPRISTDLTCSNVVTLVSKETPVANSYRNVLHDFISSEKRSFTKMAILQESWKLWDHILRDFDEMEPKIYGKPEEMLDLVFPKKEAGKTEL